jgi:hypothetical protein
VFQIVLVLLLFAMTAIGVNLTGIGGLVADVAGVVFIATLGCTVAAIAFGESRARSWGDPSWDETDLPRWEPKRPDSEYHLEDETSGSLPSMRVRRRT